MWDKEAPEHFGAAKELEYLWPAEEFEKNLDAWYERYVASKLKAKTVDDAEKVLEVEGEKIDMIQLSASMQDYEAEAFITELYWRLRNSFDTISVRGEAVPLTKENLEQVAMMTEDRLKLAKATARGSKGDIEKDFLPLSESDVEKNSETKPQSSTE
jgi:hypothetical protein